MAKQVMNILEQHNISSFLVYKVDPDTLEAHAYRTGDFLESQKLYEKI